MAALQPSPHSCEYRVLTNMSSAGAVGIVQLVGNIDDALQAIGLGPVATGRVVLRDLMGIDQGLVARWSPELLHLMPHGGLAVMQALAAALDAKGLRREAPVNEFSETASLRREYPEALSDIEARALAALSHASSPLAVDLLLAQAHVWARAIERADNERAVATDPVRDRTLRRLIEPPTIAVIGPANVGKSTLMNALAGRAVSIVADVPGTTRDHVGVTLNLAGLVVRAIDTPGLREAGEADPIERAAMDVAMHATRAADLVVVCGDAAHGLPSAADLPPGLLEGSAKITVATRDDLGPAAFPADVRVSVHQGTGLSELVSCLRDRLVPSAMLTEDPWRFWKS